MPLFEIFFVKDSIQLFVINIFIIYTYIYFSFLNKYDINTIYLSIVRNNDIARALYEELGFRYTSIDDLNGELIFKYNKH